MKRSILLASVLISTPVAMAQDTYWATGVNEHEGWYDYNKKQDGSEWGLCWAICAANLISWWQNAQASESLPADVPTGNEVWEVYRNSFSNLGSDPDQGIRWWFSGKYEPMRNTPGQPAAVITDTATGAYYKDRDGAGDKFIWKLLHRKRGSEVTVKSLSQALYEGFRRGDAFWIGVSYYRPNGQLYTHSLAVWGAECEVKKDGTPVIKAIYMTDSDDKTHCLHRIPIKEEKGQLKFDCPKHPLYGRIGDISITNYTGLKTSL